MPQLDLDFVRSQFPAFSEPSLQGWAFFENAGGSYACGAVVERLHRYYCETKVQPYANYPASAKAGAQMDEAYQRLAAYMNVDEDELNFGPSTSQNTYVLAQAFRGMWQAGDEIIVTNQDHEANSGAWRRLESTGIVVREWKINSETALLDPQDLDDLLTQKTRLLVFPHCSNVVGHVNPVADIAAKAHAVGAHVVTDGVAYAPHGLPDIDELGVDVYLFSSYKTYGPHQGIMVVRSALRDQLVNQSHYFNAKLPHKKLTPAGPDHAQIAASAGMADYFDAIHDHHFSDNVPADERGRRIHTLFRQSEEKRLAPLLTWLDDQKSIELVGPADATIRAPTVAVVTKEKSAAFIARELAEHKVMAGNGNFYAVRVLDGLNIPLDPGVLRMSFVHYTTDAEVNQLIQALDTIL